MRIFVAHLLSVQGLSSLSATFMVNYRLSRCTKRTVALYIIAPCSTKKTYV